MKNKTIFFNSEDEKTAKLSHILQRHTNHALTKQQEQQLNWAVRIKRCYEIDVLTDVNQFSKALVLVESSDRRDTGQIVFGQILFGKATDSYFKKSLITQQSNSAAAIITRNGRSTILIYVPNLLQKGVSLDGQRTKAPHRI